MFDWPARMKTFSGFAQSEVVATMRARKVAASFMGGQMRSCLKHAGRFKASVEWPIAPRSIVQSATHWPHFHSAPSAGGRSSCGGKHSDARGTLRADARAPDSFDGF